MSRYKNPISCVYKIGFANKWYIGSTKCFDKRKQEHFYKLKRGTHTNKNLQDIFDNFPIIMEIIEKCEESLLKEIEQTYLNIFENAENIVLLNIYKDSTSPKGYKYSDEVCQKKSESMKGMFVGIPRSQETKLKMSKKLKGRFIDEEWRNKISNTLKGRPSKGGRFEIKRVEYLGKLYTYTEFADLIGKSHSYISTLYGKQLDSIEKRYNCKFLKNKEV